ncbi:phosphatidylinositol-3-phosphate-binding protein BEM1 [Sporobolomyces salmoneus]|uniref:phosphatidylinositol-3-phosphate-binding protein BEM1 n=1 Tax=Sporobolomyces salmoneus TaxID=183962 RepID=UPI003182720D
MKGIRRSLNKDRIGAPSNFVSSSSNSAGAKAMNGAGFVSPIASSARPLAAPAPPKRVIRATASYKATTPQELTFEEGDFFHVVSDEGGEDWFDAANPMTGARGLVPADRFQVLGRNVRENPIQGQAVKKSSTGASSSGSGSGSGAHSSWKSGGGGGGGGSSQSQHNPYGNGASSSSAPAPSPAVVGGRPVSSSSPRHQPLYGVVQYDFVAERADELDAKRGEPIIVIAQSNHEWFVAKPIGRLGGPGLIPVAFVEIQDMSTGKPVENVAELIKSAVVPKVEEWKKMTADYKSASIPLGRFDFASQSNPPPQQQQQPSSSSQFDPNTHPSQHSPTYDPSNQNYQPQQGGEEEESTGYVDHRYSYSRERHQYGLVTSASVESFHQEEGSFWFHLRAFFSTGASLVLYRLYQDFYEFQIALMDEFPVEAGRVPGEDGRLVDRILPMMPGPTEYEDEVVCAQRVHDLSIYLADLCALPQHIRGSGLFYEFLVPRAGDVEVSVGQPGSGGDDEQPSPMPGSHAGLENQYGDLVDYLDQMDPRSSSAQGQVRRSGDVADQLQGMSLNGSQQDSRSYQETYYPESNHNRAPSRDQQQYQQQPPPLGTANQNVPFIKIKIFHRNTDDLIAIRVPPTVSHRALLDKVRERLGSDVANLRYREEGGDLGLRPNSNSQIIIQGGARLIGLENDQELERWVRSGARLVLYAD